MRNICYVLLITAILGLVTAGITKETVAAEKEDKNKVQESKIQQIIFIKKSQACACTQKRIDDADRVLKKVFRELDYKIPKKDLDILVDITETTKLNKQTKWNFIPVLIFLDDEGNIIDKLEGFITEKKLQTIIKENERRITKSEDE